MKLKPVLDKWAVKEVFFDEIGNPVAYREVPDTHRVVSVETLQRLLQETLYYASKKELQAIIDNKGAK